MVRALSARMPARARSVARNANARHARNHDGPAAVWVGQLPGVYVCKQGRRVRGGLALGRTPVNRRTVSPQASSLSEYDGRAERSLRSVRCPEGDLSVGTVELVEGRKNPVEFFSKCLLWRPAAWVRASLCDRRLRNLEAHAAAA